MPLEPTNKKILLYRTVAFKSRSDAHITQRSPKPSDLHLASHVNHFRAGGECELPKGQMVHNPYPYK